MCPNSARQTGQAPASFGATCTEIKPLHCSQHAAGVTGQKAENTAETGLILFLFLLSFLLFPLFLQNRSVALDVVFLFTNHLST